MPHLASEYTCKQTSYTQSNTDTQNNIYLKCYMYAFHLIGILFARQKCLNLILVAL